MFPLPKGFGADDLSVGLPAADVAAADRKIAGDAQKYNKEHAFSPTATFPGGWWGNFAFLREWPYISPETRVGSACEEGVGCSSPDAYAIAQSVARYQMLNKLTVDGKFGPQTVCSVLKIAGTKCNFTPGTPTGGGKTPAKPVPPVITITETGSEWWKIPLVWIGGGLLLAAGIIVAKGGRPKRRTVGGK